MTELPSGERSLISLTNWIQYTNVTDRHTDRQADGRTDGRTDTGRQLRPHLRIASRGNQCKGNATGHNKERSLRSKKKCKLSLAIEVVFLGSVVL